MDVEAVEVVEVVSCCRCRYYDTHILHHLSLPRTRRFLSCFSGSDLVNCAWGFPVTDSGRRSLGLGLMKDVFLVTDTDYVNRGKGRFEME